MLIKSADDKSKRLVLLQDLQQSPMLDARPKECLSDELRRCNASLEGERAPDVEIRVELKTYANPKI